MPDQHNDAEKPGDRRNLTAHRTADRCAASRERRAGRVHRSHTAEIQIPKECEGGRNQHRTDRQILRPEYREHPDNHREQTPERLYAKYGRTGAGHALPAAEPVPAGKIVPKHRAESRPGGRHGAGLREQNKSGEHTGQHRLAKIPGKHQHSRPEPALRHNVGHPRIA